VREIDLREFENRTMPNVLRDQAEHIGDDVWLMFGEVHRTYNEVNECVNRYSHGLRRQGVGLGDIVAILMDDQEDYVLVCLALAKLGAIHLTINTAYKGPYLEHVLGHSQTERLLVEPKYLSRVHALLPNLPKLRQVIVQGADTSDPLGNLEVLNLKGLLSDNVGEPSNEVLPSTVMSVLYTSGTTGLSKGAMMSHGYWTYASQALYRIRDARPGDVFFCPTPMFHAGVWLYNIYSALLSGLSVGIDDHFSVTTFWDRVRLYQATHLQTIGAMHMFLWAQPESPDDADNSARVWVPVPLPPELWEPFKKRFGIQHLVFNFGQTEVVPVTSSTVGSITKPGSAGTAMPHLEVKIFDENDEEQAPDVTGEICIRPKEPHTMFEGYLNNPEATVNVWRNLWHHTGDLGKMDEDGELYYVDRKQDFLRRRGENISSFEVESAVARHEAIAAVVAHAVPSEYTEDELKICVLLKDGATLNYEELFEHCVQNLPYFCVPRYLEFIDELPLTPSGRVQKYLLRQRGVSENTWDRDAAGLTVMR
jgi:crotonobetaine/carnitine-CoA ligase